MNKVKEAICGKPEQKEVTMLFALPEGRLDISRTDGPPLEGDPVGEYTKHFVIEVSPKDYVWAAYELQYKIYRAVYGLLASLTKREIMVLRMRIYERRSITETASALGVKPQSVVAFQRSIKRKVQRYLGQL